MSILNSQRGLTYTANTLHCGGTHRRLRHRNGLVLHQNDVEPVEFVSTTCEACDTRWHTDQRWWGQWCCLRLALCGSDDATLALVGVLDANKGLINIVCKQPAKRHVLTAQHDDVSLFSGLHPLRLEARELFSGVRGP